MCLRVQGRSVFLSLLKLKTQRQQRHKERKKAMCMFSSLLFNQTFYSTEQAIISKIPIHTTDKKNIFHLMHMLYKPWHQHVNDTVIYIIHVSFEKRVTNFPVYLKIKKNKKNLASISKPSLHAMWMCPYTVQDYLPYAIDTQLNIKLSPLCCGHAAILNTTTLYHK